VCKKLKEKDAVYPVRREENAGGCYMAYPQNGNSRQRTWYEARNKCLRLGGDLAMTKVTGMDWLEKNQKHWIGLQRDPLMKTLPGGTLNHKYLLCILRGK